MATVVVALPVVVWAVLAWRQRWVADDAFINFRVVDHLLAGHGPVFNVGERVEIATSPLWVALLTLAALALPFPIEWLAVVGGLGLSLGGLVLAQLGARRIRPGRSGVLLPAGALVVVALPPFWDFATSGLETGLSFAWLGACTYALAGTPLRPTRVALLVGLGPLIRPDFAVFAAAFLVALLLLADTPFHQRLRLVAVAAAAPLAFQVFRMGYYAALVPNTALAKEASLARWDQGWAYLGDLVGPYWLALPVVGLLVTTWGPGVVEALRAGDRRQAVLVVTPVLAAALHGLYVVRVGGDFMHARLLLPPLFLGLAPVAMGAMTGARAVAYPALLGWAVVCATSLRVDYPEVIGSNGIADERAVYVGSADPPPITIEEHAVGGWAKDGLAVAERTDDGRRVLVLHPQFSQRDEIVLPRGGDHGPDVVYAGLNVGLLGYAAGTEAFVFDAHGLGDPLAARLELGARGRPGHEKVLQAAWVLARYADPSAPPPPGLVGPDEVEAARTALRCGEVPALFEAVSGPLDPSRFLANLGEAVRLHDLRVPGDPTTAVARLCG